MKDLQAFEQLKDLASGKSRPRVQWLSLEEKKGLESKTLDSKGSRGSNSSSNSKASVKPSFLQETGRKDERVLEAQTDESLRNLSQARLKALLVAQQNLANSPLCKRLPDGGAKIHKKTAQIQAALDYVVQVDALVLGLEVNMSQLKLDEKSDAKQQLEVDLKFRDSVARKVQLAQRAKMPYSQASHAITLTPSGKFPGVAAKYRSGAPKFLTLTEAGELHRAAHQRALTLQEKEQPSAVIGSKGSAFRTAHWHKPDVDFSSEAFREPISDFDDDEEEEEEEEEEDDFDHCEAEEEEEEEEEEENEGGSSPFVTMFV